MGETRFLIDTNVVIGLLNGNPASIALIEAANCPLAQMAVSQITRMELLGFAGITITDEKILESMLTAMQVIPVDAAVEAGVIALRRARNIKLPDAIIAATAMSRSLSLLSLDQALVRIVGSVEIRSLDDVVTRWQARG